MWAVTRVAVVVMWGAIFLCREEQEEEEYEE
jgi:hypothetical protein